MAVITIGQFGGLMPSLQARNLPDASAQTAHNLDLRYGDFRPLPGPGAAVTTVAAATKSLFRTPSGVWLSSTNDVNYVNGQINDAESERVYLTGRSAYPEAWEGGLYRQLGVPAPTVAPTATLVASGEFTDEELDDAREEIQAAIVDAADDALAETTLGDAIPAGGPTDLTGADPLYQYVELHLRMDGAEGSKNFVDSSRLGRAISANTAVIAAGSGLTGGGNVARFNGGKGLTFSKIEADRAEDWQLDIFFKPTIAVGELEVGSFNMRVTYLVGGSVGVGGYNLAGNTDRETRDATVITSSGPAGAGIPTVGVTQRVTLVNRGGTDLRLILRGVVVGSEEARGIDLDSVGWVNEGAGMFGDIDEVRFTKGIQRDDTDFLTTALTPFPNASGAQGFWLMHGAVTPMPTTDALQAVYCVPVVQHDGEYIAINPDQNYLLGPAFRGQKIDYLSEEYWAIPMFYRASGYTVDRAGFLADLLAIENPATPPDPLFTNAQATSIVNEVLDPFDVSKDPAKEYVRQINLQQQAVINAISTGTQQSSGTSVSAIASLESAVQSATSYFSNLFVKVAASARDIFNELVEPILPEAVTRTLDTRAYVYTYVTDWGEESAPSPASTLLELDQNDSVDVDVSAPPSGRHIVGWRLYRSSTTNVGAAYQLVADKVVSNAVLDGVDFDYFDISDLGYSDSKKQEELQEVLATLTWVEPPANLIGLVGLPNGIMAGFFGQTLCFSEPFAPYAWPIEYQLTLEYNIVGLGVFGQTLVVVTEGNPYYASGADSASMSTQKLESTQSCVSKRTIASMEGGVVYASPDGLCLAGPDGVQLLTYGAFERKDWEALAPQLRFGGFHEGVYYIFPMPGLTAGTAAGQSTVVGRSPREGLLNHFEELDGNGYVVSSIGPNLVMTNGAELAANDGGLLFGDSVGYTNGLSNAEFQTVAGQSILGSCAGRSWRLEFMYVPTSTTNFGTQFILDNQITGASIEMGGTNLAAFTLSILSSAYNGGGAFGGTEPVLGARNHFALQYRHDTLQFALFHNGSRQHTFSTGADPYPTADWGTGPTFTRFRWLGSQTGVKVDEVYLHFNPSELYGDTYTVPSGPFADPE